MFQAGLNIASEHDDEHDTVNKNPDNNLHYLLPFLFVVHFGLSAGNNKDAKTPPETYCDEYSKASIILQWQKNLYCYWQIICTTLKKSK